MAKEIKNYYADEANNANKWCLPEAGDRKDQRRGAGFASVLIESKLGQVSRNSTISARRERGPDAACFCDAQSFYFTWVDSTCVMSTGTWGSPCADTATFEFESQSPSGFNFFDVLPTDLKLGNWVCNDQPFIVENNLGTKQKNVNQVDGHDSDEYASPFGHSSALNEARPEKESRHSATDSTQPVVDVRPKHFGASHLPILSQLPINLLKAVR